MTDKTTELDDLRAAARSAFEDTSKDDETPPLVEEKANEEPITEEPTGEKNDGEGTPEPKASPDGKTANTTAAPSESPTEPVKRTSSPASWKPEAKAMFDTLPPAVKEEIHRRESETNELLRSSKSDRELAGAFKQIADPYLEDMKAIGTNPIAVFQDFMQAAATLRKGSPEQKADFIGRMCAANGVDINMLNTSIQHYYNPQAMQQTQLQQTIARLEAAEKQREEALMSQTKTLAQKEYDAFLATNPPHFETLKPMMRLLIENEQAASYQEAYDMALHANPTLRATASLPQQALKPALSVKNEGPRSSAKPSKDTRQVTDLRDAARAAFMKVNGRAPS